MQPTCSLWLIAIPSSETSANLTNSADVTTAPWLVPAHVISHPVDVDSGLDAAPRVALKLTPSSNKSDMSSSG